MSMAPSCLGNGAALLPALLAAALGAGGAKAFAQDPIPGRGAPPGAPAPETPESDVFTLRSTAFGDGARIPDRFTVEGDDVSPPLTWSGAPAGTRSFAIICEDLDVSGRRPFVHWVIYGIPGDATELPGELPRERELETPVVAKQGTNSWTKDNTGYRGPATPRGDKPHRYRFTLYALKAEPDARPGLNAEALRHRIKDLIVEETSIVGTYSRARKPGETPPGVQEKELPATPSAPKAPSTPTTPSDPKSPPSKPEPPPSRRTPPPGK